ncbi:outer membrane protein assembly factor BamE [Sulfuritortus calidifontis]|uniref:Outer membrane protein assembly factor BamE n=2 Tax=Sulfuritortus calidifontis TaxID=1914471 RepID=A0A4R3JXA3_9PROT|nr:outer membrane protein assembly factor BamE [Sulfuritortus calidifontis]
MRYAILLALLLTGCSWTEKIDLKKPIEALQPYKMDIQQGNVITQDMIAKLKPGMTPSQVRFALGSPLVVDPFRNNRWDYVYRLEKGGKLVEARRITVVFENDVLKGIEGDVTALPAATKPAEAQPQPAVAPIPEAEKK